MRTFKFTFFVFGFVSTVNAAANFATNSGQDLAQNNGQNLSQNVATNLGNNEAVNLSSNYASSAATNLAQNLSKNLAVDPFPSSDSRRQVDGIIQTLGLKPETELSFQGVFPNGKGCRVNISLPPGRVSIQIDAVSLTDPKVFERRNFASFIAQDSYSVRVVADLNSEGDSLRVQYKELDLNRQDRTFVTVFLKTNNPKNFGSELKEVLITRSFAANVPAVSTICGNLTRVD